jgi:hypothetical protein
MNIGGGNGSSIKIGGANAAAQMQALAAGQQQPIERTIHYN